MKTRAELEKNDNKILLILDLDETLIHASKEELSNTADFKVFDYHIYNRPFLQDFLLKMNELYLLAIWSSAGDEYVDEIVKRIIPKEIKLEFIWGRSRCKYQRNSIDPHYYTYGSDSHFHFVKPLKKLKRYGFTLDRILIVDDTPHKSKENYGNAIYPKAFNGETNDNELPQLSKYLESLSTRKTVRNIEKRGWRNGI